MARTKTEIKGVKKTKSTKKKTDVEEKPKKSFCAGLCNCEKPVSSFYKSYNPFHESGYLPYCKDCIRKLSVNEDGEVDINKFKKVLIAIDRPYMQDIFENSINEKGDTIGVYMKNIAMRQFRDLTYDDSRFTVKETKSTSSFNMETAVEDFLKDFIVDMEMINFWGTKNKEDLYFLENEWSNLITRFECNSYATEILFQEIAQIRLIIKKKRISGQDINKELATLQNLLTSAGIKPTQDDGSNGAEQSTYGLLIKRFENEEPIPEPEDEWKDVDGIMKYISIWFFGHLCKMLGIKNKFSKMYEEEMAKYRVELEEDDDIDNLDDIDFDNISEEGE